MSTEPSPPVPESEERLNRRERRKRVRQAFGTKLLTTFAVLLTLVTLVAFGVVGWLVEHTLYRVLEDQHGQHLEAVSALAARELNKPYEMALLQDDEETPEIRGKAQDRLNRICVELKEQAKVSEVVLFQGTEEYTVLASSRPGDESGERVLLARLYADNLDIAKSREEKEPISSPLYPHKQADGQWRNFKSAYTPVVDREGRVIAMVGIELPAQFTDDVKLVQSTFYFLGACAGIVVLLTAVFLVRQRVHVPVYRLVKAMKGGDDEQPRVARVRHMDEIGVLTEHYNDMVERLQEKDQKLRELYAAAQERAVYLEGYSAHLVAGVPSGVVAVDPVGHLTVWNDGATQALGLTEEPGTPIDTFDVEHPLRRALDRALSGSTTDQAMIVIDEPTPEGESEDPKLLELNCTPIYGESEELLGAVALFTDRTELERFRKVAERNERLAAIGNLGAGLAHEIKNPLGAIQGFAELIERKEGRDAARLAGRLRGEVEDLNEFLDEFLAFARANTIKREPLDLNSVMLRSVELALRGEELEPLAVEELCESISGDDLRPAHESDATEAGQIELPSGSTLYLRLDLDRSLPPGRGEATLLRSAFVNLIRNAIAVMPNGGMLAIRTHRIGDLVYVRFRDQGPGVPTELREKIFNPLFTTRAEGTGMGLAIANKTVTAHGGKLSVRDAPGGGAEFVIRLPLDPSRAAKSPAPSGRASATNSS